MLLKPEQMNPGRKRMTRLQEKLQVRLTLQLLLCLKKRMRQVLRLGKPLQFRLLIAR